MSGAVTVAAPAKINLELGVGPVRSDGFHALATVYQAIGLYDEVTVSAAATTTLTVVGEGVEVSDVPTDSSNLAIRAARLLAARAGVEGGVAMSIRKRIPVAGGMAGGSADAAAALLACDALWDLGTPRAELVSLAAELGSDVPFCLVGGTASGHGRGEVVSPLEDPGTYWWVAALPGGGLSTPAVYREFDRLHESSPAPQPSIDAALVDALRAGSPHRVADHLTNDLQGPALRLRPELAAVLEHGRSRGALAAVVSGSGPSCLFLAPDEDEARKIQDALQEAGTAALVAPGPVPGARVTAPL